MYVPIERLHGRKSVLPKFEWPVSRNRGECTSSKGDAALEGNMKWLALEKHFLTHLSSEKRSTRIQSVCTFGTLWCSFLYL